MVSPERLDLQMDQHLLDSIFKGFVSLRINHIETAQILSSLPMKTPDENLENAIIWANKEMEKLTR